MTRYSRIAPDERGMTIVEVAVTAMILSVMVLVMFDFLDRAGNITARTDRQSQAEAEAQLALRVATQNIRGATDLRPCEADGAPAPAPALATTDYSRCIQFDVSRPEVGLTSCARSTYVYALVRPAGSAYAELVENRTDHTGTTTCTAQAPRLRRVLLTRVVDQSAFAFFRPVGTQIDTATAAAEVPSATTVRVRLDVSYQDNAPVLSFTSSAALRNSR